VIIIRRAARRSRLFVGQWSYRDVAVRAADDGGQAVVAVVKTSGVDTDFGIPGVHNLDMCDALVESRIRGVHLRHEEGASFRADGYARSTGRPGVAITITRPGATNVLAGIGTCYSDSSSMLVTAPLTRPLIDQERGDLHDIREHAGIFRTLTAWTGRVTSVREIPLTVIEAPGDFAHPDAVPLPRY
jgi:thiamine pyrophosphate-dependent acetolactate synthase large subunit-like protein